MPPTIYALSSGRPPAGVAIIRLSGPKVRFVIETMFGRLPEPRVATYGALRGVDGDLIDRGLALFFPGPRSFTGEDVAEFQLHGSRAVIAAVLKAFQGFDDLRPAEPGEFTRLAFENGRLDLTSVEGLADLIEAETEAQRRQALHISDGALAALAEDWRLRIIGARAAVEADLDFADEDDVPHSVADRAAAEAAGVLADIRVALASASRGERIRDGFVVALMGPPNAGKSSLLNALVRRDVAIVTAEPGTTRDALEVHLDLDGMPVVLVDTAGLRASADRIEQEGMRRALLRGQSADLVLWLDEAGGGPTEPEVVAFGDRLVRIRSKIDLSDGEAEYTAQLCASGSAEPFPSGISTTTGAGLQSLVSALAGRASAEGSEPALVTRERQRHCLSEAAAALQASLEPVPLEVRADHLRRAGDAIGRLVGRIDVDDVLGAIFSRFCIGK